MPSQNSSRDDFACWLCDYGWLLAAFAIVMVLGWYLRGRWVQPNAPPVVAPIDTQTIPYATASVIGTQAVPLTETPTLQTATPAAPIFTPSPEPPSMPQYVIVVVPLAWSGDYADFEASAWREINRFTSESGINSYFDVQVILLADNMASADLRSDELIFDMVEFAAEREPADRYIGLTDGDIVLDGDRGTTGWTTGPNSLGVVGEADAAYIVAHELGHTFGLCDEYAYVYWEEQDSYFVGGCPNPFPDNCEQLTDLEPYCSGAPTGDGRNSIMGPSGLDGPYGYNAPSYGHLQEIFSEMANLNMR